MVLRQNVATLFRPVPNKDTVEVIYITAVSRFYGGGFFSEKLFTPIVKKKLSVNFRVFSIGRNMKLLAKHPRSIEPCEFR